jgi:ABC-type multidrug transport system ATPase subunit
MCLKQLSRKHSIAIVASIHQPNSLLMSMFDQLYVLSKGKCVFSGRPNQLRAHLQTCGINVEEENMPIEVLLKICSTQTIKRKKSRKESLVSWVCYPILKFCLINY